MLSKCVGPFKSRCGVRESEEDMRQPKYPSCLQIMTRLSIPLQQCKYASRSQCIRWTWFLEDLAFQACRKSKSRSRRQDAKFVRVPPDCRRPSDGRVGRKASCKERRSLDEHKSVVWGPCSRGVYEVSTTRSFVPSSLRSLVPDSFLLSSGTSLHALFVDSPLKEI